jgi:hypothetical protein
MDAESQYIAELKGLITELADALDRSDPIQDKLITELADALEPLCWTAQAHLLIQRAREATR